MIWFLSIWCTLIVISEVYYAVAIAGNIRDIDPTIFAIIPFILLAIMIFIEVIL